MGGTPEPATAPDPWIGRVLDGKYRVDSILGAGGMGSVYRVEHLRLGKVMALKVVSARVGPDAADRFEREAKVGGRIGHPNCVAVSDFGTSDDGSFYLVMELLQGESLGEVLDREGRLPWRRALAITRHVLRGLGHAHEHGVVHRDIKPDNVFLARHDDDPEFAKVLDFGIAKLVGESGTTITQAGITVGTPAYLSPEQAFGGELDGRSDLYSLSIVLYEMLDGRTPFGDRDMVAMLTAHAVAEVPAMADAAIPPAVEALVRAGLAKQPADRIPTAAEYVRRIDDVLTRVATESGVTPVITGPLPVRAQPSAQTPYPSAILTTPRPGKKIGLWVGGGILAVGAIAAIASTGSGGHATPTPPAATSAPAKPKPAKPAPTKPTEPADPPPVKAATPPPVPKADAVPLTADQEKRYQAAIKQLTKGKTCPLRKAAVAQLVELGDARAVPALKKARSRMRGGLLGIGAKNTNSCLKADAEAAIAQLTSTGT
jgi:serine/threonine-protein kinase